MKRTAPVLSITKDDFDWDYFRCSGAGGQKVNKTSSGVRCTHRPSGAVGRACDERMQSQNRRLAWQRCVDSREFRTWLKHRVDQAMLREGSTLEQRVDAELKHVRVEVFKDGAWQAEGAAV